MATNDIFLSYEKHDRADARDLAEDLAADGYSVWWDRELIGGDDFVGRIDAELRSARSVIVLWSTDSVKSRWVNGEAETAANLGKLIPVLIDDTDPGEIPSAGLRGIQCVKLRDNDGLRRALNAILKRPEQDQATGRLDRMRRWIGRCLRKLRHNLTAVTVFPLVALIVGGAWFAFEYVSWRRLDGSLTAEEYQDYVNKFPWGRLYGGVALARLAGSEEFPKLQTEEDFKRFLAQYPQSMFGELSKIRIGRLQRLERGDYKPVIEKSGTALLKPGDIGGLKCAGLWAARNEIMFRRGYCFTTENAKKYFNTAADCPKDCVGRMEINRFISNKLLSVVEYDNMEFLRGREKELSCLIALGNPDC